jgi:3-oxoacyl-[acyl-carrier protein] reductase
MKLENKVAVVVGGSSGIGKATSKLLAREGAGVMIADLNIEMANKVMEEIKAEGYEAATVKVDMTEEEEAYEMAKVTLDVFGHIDILVNVAGGSRGPFIRENPVPFANQTKEEWDRHIAINLSGARNCTRAVINHMMQRRSGKIVSFSSLAALQGGPVDYAAAKSGIIGFTKALAVEMAPYGIQVNCICPGGTLSERFQASVEKYQREGHAVDIGKFNKPEELASVVLFLVSDEITHLFGENIVVAGWRV